MKIPLYPLQFIPIFQERLWGGDKLKTLFNKPITSTKTGESWELSTIEGAVSTIANGDLAGRFITEVINEYPNEILGTSVYQRFGNQFPLLFKYLDAKEDLSVQVHPNDALAKARHHSFGKTEMWYVVQADPDARLIVGFKEEMNQATYLENLEKKTLLATLDEIKVQPGDVFLIETGTVHAIGAGMVIAEIQQTSDITYRLYDFDRVDSDGNLRELHVDLALDAINYNTVSSQKPYQKNSNQSNPVVDCPYFVTNIVALQDHFIWKKTKESFTVFMCTNGQFELILNGEIMRFQMGDTILIPAIIDHLTLKGKATILEISI